MSAKKTGKGGAPGVPAGAKSDRAKATQKGSPTAVKQDDTATASDLAPFMAAEPVEQHRWLLRLVGEWEYEGAVQEPDKPEQTFAGREIVRSVGDLWIVAEGEGEMPGGEPATTVMTLGYDPRVERFVGTWLGSMMTHLWVYDGGLDAEGRVLTLNSEGPDMSGGSGLVSYRDVVKVESDDRRTLTGQVQGENETWQDLMKATYRRTA